MCTELFRDERYSKTWTASSNALNAVFLKDPAEMTRDDAMTVACDSAAIKMRWHQGYAALCVAAGVDELVFYSEGFELHDLAVSTVLEETRRVLAFVVTARRVTDA